MFCPVFICSVYLYLLIIDHIVANRKISFKQNSFHAEDSFPVEVYFFDIYKHLYDKVVQFVLHFIENSKILKE